MAITFHPDRVVITLDEFIEGLAPAVFEQALRESGGPFDGLEVRGRRDGARRLTTGECVVSLTVPLTRAQRRMVERVIASHPGGDPLQDGDPRLQDLAGTRFGATTIRYVRRAPKVGELPEAGTGTHVYRDPDGNWRRLADDAVLRGPEVTP